jgi:2-oxoglutarate/2-oxoacid ferredoxin oxidoreductase subunit beta
MATTTVEKQKSDVILSYLRPRKKFPSVWCAGCGNGVVMSAVIRAIDRLGLDRDQTAFVSGIGCTSRMPVYLDFNSLHTTHGRALAFATGVKFAQPHMKVIVITGDGDSLAIGGNHFIHACRRNIDITCILINNNIYGMTGGQGSPTTPPSAFSTTTPYGNAEKPFDPCDLAQAAGATFVGRHTVYHAAQLEKMIMQGIEHRGFSLIEAISNCHTYFGRLNKQGDAVAMIKSFKENMVMLPKALELTPEQKKGKIVCGIFKEDKEKTEFCDEYQHTVELIKGRKN